MTEYNHITIEAYSTGVTQYLNMGAGLENSEQLTFTTVYPGGLYGSCEFFVPRNPQDPWIVTQNQRIVVRNSGVLVWEGRIIDITADSAGMGNRVIAAGTFSAFQGTRMINRRYVDNRIEDDIWVWQTGENAAEKCEISREARIRFTPKAVAWGNNEKASILYTAPVGETIKKITYTWTVAGADFTLAWWDATNGTSNIAVAPGGPTAATYTPATPINSIYLLYQCTNAKTPAADGTYYGQVTGLTVYAKSGIAAGFADTMPEICKDIVDKLSTGINSDTTHIVTPASAGAAFTSFITNDYEMISDILTRACEQTDAAFNYYHAYMLDSETAITPDSKPVLCLEQEPVLTDYDYRLSLGDQNIITPPELDFSLEDVHNWINVSYTDANGRTQWITPDNVAALKDTPSITAYGYREFNLDLGERDYDPGAMTGSALAFGKAYLARHKDIHPRMTNSPEVVDYIYTKGGEKVPTSQIRAGKRVNVSNWMDDGSGTLLTFLISETSYDDETGICSITCGPPPELFIPSFAFPELPPVDEPPKSDGGGGGGKSKRKKPPKPGPGWVWNAKKWKWVKK